MSKLWAIHIPVPDEIYAAPSEAAANHMAEKHNAAMRRYFETVTSKFDENWPSVDSCLAKVIEWPGDQEGHAEALKDFVAAEWRM